MTTPSPFCPFPSELHPQVEELQTQSIAWARALSLCASEPAYRRLETSRIGWLVARAFPEATRDGLQIAADWTTLFCLLDDRIDERSEIANTSTGQLARVLAFLLNVIRDTRTGIPGDITDVTDGCFASALDDLRQRITNLGGVYRTARFADRLESLFSAFLWEHLNRRNGISPSLAAYVTMRSITVGVLPLLELAALTDDIRLSPETLSHPAIVSLMTMCCNVVGWTNDLFTYEKEHAQGEVHNLIVLLTHEHMSIENARSIATSKIDAEIRLFISLSQHLPSFGGANADVRRYVRIMQNWMRGHLDWGTETARYKTWMRGHLD
jgi:5-epi-alpha-selinene synthase